MWGSVVRHCRDGVRISAAYCSRDAFYRLAAYFQAFPWVLKVAASTSTSLRLDPAAICRRARRPHASFSTSSRASSWTLHAQMAFHLCWE